MKKYTPLILLSLLFLTGCASKSNFSVTFDTFTIKIYDNNKQYIPIPLDTKNEWRHILTEMKEQTNTGATWFINSLLIMKTVFSSWTNIKTFVASNTKTLESKLLNYKTTTTADKKVHCPNLQYSWYVTAFSYQLDNQTIYDGQYFFTDTTSLYGISLTSGDPKDIKSFLNSIGTITCSN